jgi:CRISPR-associated protein Cas1
MLGRIVEIAEDGRHLRRDRGFLVVSTQEAASTELGRVALEDIAAVIAHAHGITYTNNLLVALAERGAPFVLCAANHNAIGMLLPLQGHHEQGRRMDAQIAASRPTRKRAWAEVVRAKLAQQATVLEAAGMPTAPLAALVSQVRSGDPRNLEAQGARRYWTLLFGSGFQRDPDRPGINALLNYGYTVLRAATARGVLAAGLHPTLGIFHSNGSNAMRLVDDLMEPFRPLVDHAVWQLSRDGHDQLTTETKRVLVNVLYEDRPTPHGISPTMVCIHRLAGSLAQVYLGERSTLDIAPPYVHFRQTSAERLHA